MSSELLNIFSLIVECIEAPHYMGYSQFGGGDYASFTIIGNAQKERPFAD
jgi:hypothetical protein